VSTAVQFPFQLPNTQIPPNYHPNADRSPPLNTVQAQNAAAIPGHIPGIPSTQNSDGRKLYVGNLPTYLTEVQVYELLQSFGRISAFNLVVDKETGALKGYGYVYFNSLILVWAYAQLGTDVVFLVQVF
jgi:RNA recognition motif-containing protein